VEPDRDPTSAALEELGAIDPSGTQMLAIVLREAEGAEFLRWIASIS